MPSHERITDQLFLEDDPKLERKRSVEHRYVQRRGVIDRVDEGLGGVDFVEPRDSDRRQDRLQDQPRPELGEVVLNASAAVEERAGQRDHAEDQRVAPDEWIVDEIRTQAAQETPRAPCRESGY